MTIVQKKIIERVKEKKEVEFKKEKHVTHVSLF